EVAADLEGNRPEPIIDEPRPRLFSVDAAVAGVLTSMLTSVVSEGTGKQAAALGRPVAGKTGTTDEARDAWFAGFTPDHAALVWVGFDAPRSLGTRESGSSLALPIWLETMERASDELPVREFDRPKTLVRALVDERSGGPACREARHWYEPQRCTRGLFFDHCEPATWRERAPFQRCVGPERWVDEVFLPGTEPGANAAIPTPIGEAPPAFDPNERAGEAPIFAAVEIGSLSLFTEAAEAPDAKVLREALEPLEARILASWRRAIEGDRRQRTNSWGYGAQPQPGSKLRYALRLRSDGSLADLRATGGGDPLLEQWAEAALREAVSATTLRLPAALLEPTQRQAELGLTLTVGRTESSEYFE
ncbi:MAG: hypothetical protein KC457_01780, partial [Myxococcales bacterium]|nr:hypothetical protein [Myxococcales bacterium]